MTETIRKKARALRKLVGELVTIIDADTKEILCRDKTLDYKDDDRAKLNGYAGYYASGKYIPVKSVRSISFEDRKIEIDRHYVEDIKS